MAITEKAIVATHLAEEEKDLTQKFLQFTDLYIERAELARLYVQQEMNTIEVLKAEREVFEEATEILAGKSHTEDLLPEVVQSDLFPIQQSISNLEQYNTELPIPSPKIGEMRAVGYHTFCIFPQKKAPKEMIAHGRVKPRLTVFKSMPG